uniref:Uncharacterized protein n=1 Tax=Aegilops tauschii subsp. strangulata TaxID=200361 RepID=A0A453AAP3_AEGTS
SLYYHKPFPNKQGQMMSNPQSHPLDWHAFKSCPFFNPMKTFPNIWGQHNITWCGQYQIQPMSCPHI